MKRMLSELAEELERAEESSWEGIYARAEVEATDREWERLIQSERRFSEWLAFRFEAGPAGSALPEPKAALRRILEGPERTPADAYSVVFGLPPITSEVVEEVGPDLVFGILFNAAVAAIGGRGHWLGWWIACRAGLAAIALGRPDLAWRVFDLAAMVKARHRHLDRLAPFEALRDEPALAKSLWVRLALQRLWPGLRVPALPSLPMPPLDEAQADEQLDDVIERLERAGATGVASLVRSLGDRVAHQYPVELDDHPIVRAVLTLVAEGRTGPLPEVESLPTGFAEWARFLGGRGRLRELHLAARLLRRHGWVDREFVAVGLNRAATTEDLPALDALYGRLPGGAAFLADVRAVADTLPAPLADAFVAATLPGHVDDQAAMRRLVENADVVAESVRAHPRFSAWAEGLTKRAADLQKFRDAVNAPEVAARCEELLNQARSAAGRLPDARAITAAQLESAVDRVSVGPLSAPLLDRLAQPVPDLRGRLVLALAVSNAVVGTPLADEWRPLFDHLVCTTIGSLEAVRLYVWRNTILDRLIKAHDPRLSLADLHFMRSNGHQAQGRNLEASADLSAARLHAEREGRHVLAVDAADGLNRLSLREARGHEDTDAAAANPEPALLAARDGQSRARVLQTRGRAIRFSDSQAALEAFTEAMGLVAPTSAFHAELAADAVAVFEFLGRDNEGIHLGRSALEAARELSSCVELAMLQLETGASLDRKGYSEEGIALMRLGVEGLRGHGIRNEGVARLKLLWTRGGLAEAELDEHERWLWDHLSEFDAGLRRDVRVWADRRKSRRPPEAPRGRDTTALDELVRGVAAGDSAGRGALWVPAKRPSGLTPFQWAELTAGLAEVERSRVALRNAVAELTSAAPDIEVDLARKKAEAAWRSARDAVPFLIAAGVPVDELSQAALECAAWLAKRLGECRGQPSDESDECWLHGTDAGDVVTWIARAGLALQRPLEARFARPRGVPFELWSAWKGALDAKPADAVFALRAIRRVDPEFLAADADLAGVWRFLGTEHGSVCVAPIAVGNLLVVGVLALGPTGARTESVLVKRVASADQAHNAGWLRSNLVEAVTRHINARPALVLWVPGPSLRNVNPSRLWGDVPVASSLGLSIASAAPDRVRPRSTLVAMADPGESKTAERPALPESGRATFDAVVVAAEPFGPVRRMISCGPAYGRAHLGHDPTVRDTPVSANDLLAEAPNHDLIVVIAHGECDRPGSASFVCIDAQGALHTLDVARLANEAEAFAGARIVLLSCDSGRVGTGHVNPGGLAGVLLAAGASCVLAPLQRLPVRAAASLGPTIVEKLSRGMAPWEVLRAIQGQHTPTGPEVLGRPAPSAAEQRARRAQRGADAKAFVSWVG